MLPNNVKHYSKFGVWEHKICYDPYQILHLHSIWYFSSLFQDPHLDVLSNKAMIVMECHKNVSILDVDMVMPGLDGKAKVYFLTTNDKGSLSIDKKKLVDVFHPSKSEKSPHSCPSYLHRPWVLDG